ncbi:MAG: zinc-ribbon domain-containing protein [Candidatus Thorarchaeota archaeon]
MATSYFNNHQIIVEKSEWTGRVTVKYDGRKVSEKLGATTLGKHVFQVTEDGRVVQYEVNVSFGWKGEKVRISRNGLMIYSNDAGFIPPTIQPTYQPQTSQKEIVKEVHVKEVVLVVCPNCNHRNDSSRRTCEKCGASI